MKGEGDMPRYANAGDRILDGEAVTVVLPKTQLAWLRKTAGEEAAKEGKPVTVSMLLRQAAERQFPSPRQPKEDQDPFETFGLATGEQGKGKAT
jgi:hypothetical protein